MNAWLRDPSFGPGLDTLCDFSRAESTPTLAELGEIVAIIKRYAAAIGRTKLAMITSRPVVFGVGRQFQALVGDGPLDVEVFTDRDAALAWLRGDQPARSDAS